MLSYNHEKYVKQSIESIFLQRKNYPNIEIILIDDGSTDNTYTILNQLKVISPIPMKLIQNKHEGIKALPKNLNALIKMAKGKYIAMLASDDEFTSNRFTKQLAILEERPSVQFVYGNGLNIIKNRKELTNSEEIIQMMKKGNTDMVYDYIITHTSPLYLQSILIRSSFLSGYTPFDEDIIADDWVFNIRAFHRLIEQKLDFSYIEDILFKRNIHTTNTSNDTDTHYLRINQVICKYIPDNRKKTSFRWFYYTFTKAYLKKLKLLISFKLFILFILNELSLLQQKLTHREKRNRI